MASSLIAISLSSSMDFCRDLNTSVRSHTTFIRKRIPSWTRLKLLLKLKSTPVFFSLYHFHLLSITFKSSIFTSDFQNGGFTLTKLNCHNGILHRWVQFLLLINLVVSDARLCAIKYDQELDHGSPSHLVHVLYHPYFSVMLRILIQCKRPRSVKWHRRINGCALYWTTQLFIGVSYWHHYCAVDNSCRTSGALNCINWQNLYSPKA